MLFRCHCSNCRKAYANHTDGKYSVPSIDWCCNVKIEGETMKHCTCAKGIFCLRRHECPECRTPVGAYGHGGLTGMGFVNYDLINAALPPNQKLKPDINIFYDSGLKGGDDGIPTYYSDCGSLVGLVAMLTGRICTCKGGCCCC